DLGLMLRNLGAWPNDSRKRTRNRGTIREGLSPQLLKPVAQAFCRFAIVLIVGAHGLARCIVDRSGVAELQASPNGSERDVGVLVMILPSERVERLQFFY